jgi:hypothetical protein
MNRGGSIRGGRGGIIGQGNWTMLCPINSVK